MKTRIEEAAKDFCMGVSQGRESMGAYNGFIAGAEFMQGEVEKFKVNDSEWFDIPGFNGFYMINKSGEVKSLRRITQTITGKVIVSPEIILKPFPREGYLGVSLSRGLKSKHYVIHRLVMLTFHGVSRLHVNHKNGIKTDNRLENLEYVTQKENNNHARHVLKVCPNGSGRNTNASLDDIQALTILTMTNMGNTEVSNLTGVNRSIVSMIRRGISYNNLFDYARGFKYPNIRGKRAREALKKVGEV